jgi:hypothetical protein
MKIKFELNVILSLSVLIYNWDAVKKLLNMFHINSSYLFRCEWDDQINRGSNVYLRNFLPPTNRK